MSAVWSLSPARRRKTTTKCAQVFFWDSPSIAHFFSISKADPSRQETTQLCVIETLIFISHQCNKIHVMQAFCAAMAVRGGPQLSSSQPHAAREGWYLQWWGQHDAHFER